MGNAGGLIDAICMVLIILTSRIFRAILIIIVMGVAFNMLNGSLTMQKAFITVFAIFLIVAPGNFAVLLLPSTITNVSGSLGGKTFSKAKKYTPEEIISASCPAALL